MTVQRFQDLLQRYKAESLSQAEWDEFCSAARSGAFDDLLDRDFQAVLEAGALHPSYTKELERSLWERIRPEETLAPVKAMNTRKIRWIAAASILLVASAYYLMHPSPKPPAPAPVQAIAAADVKAPQTNRATITLAGGQKVFLDSVANGQLAMQGHVKLVKTAEGKIDYEGPAQLDQQTKVAYNTLTNPRGSKVIYITLADGSKVWLNASSSLRYPVAFTGKERNVEFTGEAYFEIAHRSDMPFTVKKMGDDTRIDVLGTNFNINAFDDEAALKVTLLQGSVKVSKGKNENLIKPGQQAQIKNGSIKVTKEIDMDEVMAWKNGKFQFGEKTDLEAIMRQIARWYDVNIEYQGKTKEYFWGSISRNVNASQVFRMLETTGAVKFRIEGKKVLVIPGTP